MFARLAIICEHFSFLVYVNCDGGIALSKWPAAKRLLSISADAALAAVRCFIGADFFPMFSLRHRFRLAFGGSHAIPLM